MSPSRASQAPLCRPPCPPRLRNFFIIIVDTSPTYLYFLIVPCYYIICFGCLMGFNMHFYIIFGTNLLTEGLVQIVVFCLFQCFAEKEYQTERNLWEDLSWNKCNPGDLQYKSGSPRSFHETGGRPRGVGAPTASWPPRFFLDVYSKSPGSCLFQKQLSWRFHSVWYSFSSKYWNRQKTAIWAGPPVSRLVPKMI